MLRYQYVNVLGTKVLKTKHYFNNENKESVQRDLKYRQSGVTGRYKSSVHWLRVGAIIAEFNTSRYRVAC